MRSGELCGDHDVPEPIWPQYRRLSVGPIRTAMSFPFMTSIGPMSCDDILSISPLEPGDGLAVGIGMFISCRREACGDGEGIAIFMFIVSGEGDGEGDGDAGGIFIPGID